MACASPTQQAPGHRTGWALTEPTAWCSRSPTWESTFYPQTLLKIEMQPGMRKEGAGIHHSTALSVWHTKIPQRTSQAREGTDLQTMFSAQPAEFHSLGALRTQRKQPGTLLRSTQWKCHSSRLLGVRWSCQAEGAGPWSKGEKWGTTWLIWEGRRCSKGLWKGQGGKARRWEGWSRDWNFNYILQKVGKQSKFFVKYRCTTRYKFFFAKNRGHGYVILLKTLWYPVPYYKYIS